MSIYDSIIVGGGPSGFTSGIFIARAGLNTLLIERSTIGGQVIMTSIVDNYPGFPDGIAGTELIEKMRTQAEKFGLKVQMSDVRGLKKCKDIYHVILPDAELRTLSVILAVGARSRRLDIPGEQEFTGKGVSYCATCDAPFFKGKKVIIVGGGNRALEEAVYLTRFAREVKIVHRKNRFRAEDILVRQAEKNGRIGFIMDSVLERISGESMVKEVEIKNLITGKNEMYSADGVFIFVGTSPNTGLFSGSVHLDEKGFVITDEDMQTSADGIFACGDCRKKKLRQVITACSDGALAAISAQKYLDKLKGQEYL